MYDNSPRTRLVRCSSSQELALLKQRNTPMNAYGSMPNIRNPAGFEKRQYLNLATEDMPRSVGKSMPNVQMDNGQQHYDNIYLDRVRGLYFIFV